MRKKSGAEAVFVSKITHHRTSVERVADWFTASFGTVSFLVANTFLFLAWVVINLEWIPGVPAFDPYPFNFLTTAVSLEAIFLSIIVLMSQNRDSKVATLREEMDLQINLQSEREITKILQILDRMEKKTASSRKNDPDLTAMLTQVDLEQLEQTIIKALDKADK